MARLTNKNFQRARQAARLTQEQASDLLPVPLGTLRDWEQKDSAPVYAYELLMLKTGQFKVHAWKPPKGDLRGELQLKIGAGTLSLMLYQDQFEQLVSGVRGL